MQTDLLGKHLEIGDYVFVTRKNYRDIVVARVFGFTPKQVRVTYMSSYSSTHPEEYLTYQVIKIDKHDLERISDKEMATVNMAYNKITGRTAA